MKTLFTAVALIATGTLAYSQCSPDATITLGNCLTGRTFPQTQNGFVGGCNGGSHPFTVFQFVAPTSCVDFDITNIAGNGTSKSWQYRFSNSSCGQVYADCVDNVNNSQAFSISADNVTGTYQLTPGSTYYLEIMCDAAGASFDICMSNTVSPSDACSGALGLSTIATTYYNGGAGCAFTGNNTGGSGDPGANLLCAGTLENTQWITFTPLAGTTSFQVNGTNIGCTGGNCAWQFGIFSSPAACGALTPEGCVSNGNSCGHGPDGSQTVPVPAGTTSTYTMAWSGVSTTTFTGTVSIASGTYTGLEKFYLIMDGNLGASCTYTLQGSNLAPLPVDLIYFTVKKLNNGNLVKYEVSAQINNDYFAIQRSEDGENWEDIGLINGAGTTQQQMQYSFLDSEYRKAVNYYRLKQVDYNGQTRYSDPVAVNNTEDAKAIKACYNSQGQEIAFDAAGLVIIQYVDGTIQKVFNP